ncbi:MAG: hypothetical protein A3I07_01175 [Candidatus Doudnabacteria bacterium RIFCSPLOWO2_02_FULL_42_9]|uniref:Aminoglycoside phosphotransferase domain-containing protein n=1 Tax=Candidatus Doudnabacteria bacterium RIFCSPHIGHO2_01_FULL_41_86 TaxID=1817821 RepID=A0A1F5N889_9BACT|nr:MAG: hypothetical protein A2717_04505 [Candidatus Doudnabacteria bacterium RIFCSPHIGHO2_01_FULL_41_86]OGE75874.1 MAG: hypothetical protein A3K07_04100 [Candidatus Doudnabacteria bacterium RIFCSPHIGHO2_01_43_10]OGE86248.1 MAG: hypothetical protein A3E28_03860 [Candidatus Doudnabacteria bacterium RIFCSPHIGHO2_12_FULL_42_22]OGE87096.1 MAG: hypothetical protein A3C49_03525 [Candidatus Doudnabacteria bacterium RIFCSPHIGHO2_02_FULL_42_25]OGE92236.1 MAG: hypothetical protein A2895_04210 [Candidatus
MKYPSTITINRINYNLVREQRSGTAIYRSDSTYLRIGSIEKIGLDLELHKQMVKVGFPLARVLEEGEYQDMSYFVEESLGSLHFGEIFKQETESTGYVLDESFETFLHILKIYAEAQVQTIVENKDWDEFRHGIHLDIIIRELPHLEKEILETYKRAEQNLEKFPFAIQHGDLTPFNIYPKGIIDLEDSFLGPVGYDIGAFLTIQNWFPEKADDEFYRVYKFTEDQVSKFKKTVADLYNSHGLPRPSDYEYEFNLTKGIWFTVRMHELPKLQQFRYNTLNKLLAKSPDLIQK